MQDIAAMRQDWCSACAYYDVCPTWTPLTVDCTNLRDRGGSYGTDEKAVEGVACRALELVG